MSYTMTAAEWVKRMEWITDYPRSSYRNEWPFNVLYWDGSRWFGDCVCIQKALLNGRNVYSPEAGSYQRDLSKTGDCTEWGLMEQCSDVSSDFTKLKTGEPRLLYKPGHIGAYLGKEKTVKQGVVNCVECTPAWEDGIQYSYVDEWGGRSYYKGGPAAGAWTHHGKPSKWIDYSNKEEQKEEKKEEKKPYLYFKDITGEGTNIYKATKWLKQQGAIVGYADGTYRPDEPLTRGGVALILWKLFGRP